MITSYADCYHENRSDPDAQSNVILDLISEYIGNPTTCTILDIGSGSGRLAVPLSRAVNQIVCVDSDRTALTHLKNRSTLTNVNVKTICSSLEQLKTENVGRFDLVLMSHILHWLGSDFSFNTISKLMHKNSYILLSFFAKETLDDMLFYKISGEETLKTQYEMTPDINQIENSLLVANIKLIDRIDVPIQVKYGNSRLDNIITSAGTLAWKMLRSKLPIKEYLEIVQSALLRLAAESKSNPTLSDTEYRTMLLGRVAD